MTIPNEIRNLVARGALIIVNHSGGKDSQAMLVYLNSIGIPQNQLLVIHADLGDVEWQGTQTHIRDTIGNLPMVIARASKTFFDMVEHRQMFPSAGQRQCTSDLKRGPIEREIRRYLKNHPEFKGLVVNCMGMRAQESPSRAKKEICRKNEGNSVAGRTWYDWLPIHNWTTEEVFAAIEKAGQKPHWAYSKGMTRLSCMFCILASKADLTRSAQLNPSAYKRYVQTEKRIGHTLSMSGKPLEEVTEIKISN